MGKCSYWDPDQRLLNYVSGPKTHTHAKVENSPLDVNTETHTPEEYHIVYLRHLCCNTEGVHNIVAWCGASLKHTQQRNSSHRLRLPLPSFQHLHVIHWLHGCNMRHTVAALLQTCNHILSEDYSTTNMLLVWFRKIACETTIWPPKQLWVVL